MHDISKLVNSKDAPQNATRDGKIIASLLDAYVDAFLFEPADEVDSLLRVPNGNERKFIFDPPQTLPKYLKDFATGETTIDDSLELARVKLLSTAPIYF
jgi:hypothetical protein